MSEPTHLDSQQVRRAAQQIVERLQSDPSFHQQVLDHPVDSLLAAGLPERALPDFMREMNLVADVVGYDFIGLDACNYTCCTTDVPNEGLPGTPSPPYA